MNAIASDEECRSRAACIGTVSPVDHDEEMSEDDGNKHEEREEEGKEVFVEGTRAQEEARKPAVPQPPKRPSRAVVDEHNLTHMPYQAWCPDCVRGRGLGARHVMKERTDEEMRIPVVAADYAFMGDETDDEKLTILVMRDDKVRATCCTSVKNKGAASSWAVKRSLKFLEGLGFGRIVFKSDSEHSITDLWNAIRAKREADTVPECAPKGESQANGVVEKAVQEVQGVVRTLKSGLEKRIGKRIKISDDIIHWIVEHAGFILTRYKVSVDGMTAYERLKGRPNRKKVCEIGETVLFKPVRAHSETHRFKLNPNIDYGVWLGVNPRNNEDLVGTSAGVFRASVVKRVPEDERWSADKVFSVKGTLAEPAGAEEEEERKEDHHHEDQNKEDEEGEDGDAHEEEAKVRRMYIRKQDIEKYGKTDGCPGCSAISRGRAPACHTEKCRKRITERIKEDPAEASRVNQAEARFTDRIAREIEREEKHQAKQARKAAKDTVNQEGQASKPTQSEPGKKEASNSNSSSSNRRSEGEARTPSGATGSAGNHGTFLAQVAIKRRAGGDDPGHEDGIGKMKKIRREEEQDSKKGKKTLREGHGDDEEKSEDGGKKRRTEEEMAMSLAEAGQIRGPAVRILDLTSAEETVRAARQGRDRWMSAARKAVLKHRPDVVIGGSVSRELLDVTGDQWGSVYELQADVGGYFVHMMATGKGDCQTSTWRAPAQKRPRGRAYNTGTCYDKQRKMKIKVESNCDKIIASLHGCKVESVGTKIRNVMKRQHHTDITYGKELCTMDVSGNVWDDVRGGWLNSEMVKKSREEEMEYVRSRGLYDRVPWKQAVERTGKPPIQLKWVDTNKGTVEMPMYRSRLVAMEFKRDKRLDLFAPTPPLEAMKLIISRAASNGEHGSGKALMAVDIKRAYFYARSVRETYVDLPKEDYQPGDEQRCGRLNMSMYGTRDAAMNWDKELRNTLEGMRFKAGKASTCIYRHLDLDSTAAVHGDDILMEGYEEDLWKLFKALQSKYECKMQVIGAGNHLRKSLKVLNRTVVWRSDGISIEADARHVGEIIKEAHVKDDRRCMTPMTKDCMNAACDGDVRELDGIAVVERKVRGRIMASSILKSKEARNESSRMSVSEATRFRGVAARLNYLAHDRVDLKTAAGNICKKMSDPMHEDWEEVKRVAMYLKYRPRLACVYRWQSDQAAITGYSDANWAGDKTSRRSTSGGCILVGTHFIKSWSKSQHVIALSSGEAELYAAVKAGSECAGMKSLLNDLGTQADIGIQVDATAAIGMLMKEGLTGVRHIDTQFLWLQEAIKQKRMTVRKIATERNPSDILTKSVPPATLERHLRALACEWW